MLVLQCGRVEPTPEIGSAFLTAVSVSRLLNSIRGFAQWTCGKPTRPIHRLTASLSRMQNGGPRGQNGDSDHDNNHDNPNGISDDC